MATESTLGVSSTGTMRFKKLGVCVCPCAGCLGAHWRQSLGGRLLALI